MLEQVLSECKDRVVNSTVRNLPLTTVVPFLKTVSSHCYGAVWKCTVGHWHCITCFVLLCSWLIFFKLVPQEDQSSVFG